MKTEIIAEAPKMDRQQLLVAAHIVLNKIEKNINFIVNDIKRKKGIYVLEIYTDAYSISLMLIELKAQGVSLEPDGDTAVSGTNANIKLATKFLKQKGISFKILPW